MKHKIIFITILILAVAFYSYAQIGITIKPYLGYSAVSLGSINSEIKRFFDIFPQVQGIEKSVDYLDISLVGGLQVGYDVLSDPSIGKLNVGVGAYYLYVLPGGVKLKDNNFPATLEATYNASLIPILGGISYTYEIDPVYFGANANVGYGFASLSSSLKIEVQGQQPSITNTSESGSGLVVDGRLIIGFKVIKELSIELNVGYRHAPIGNAEFSGLIATLGANIMP